MNTYFYELSGEAAKETLLRLEIELKKMPQVSATRLLISLEQEGLFLLVVEASKKPQLSLPKALRVWSFTASSVC